MKRPNVEEIDQLVTSARASKNAHLNETIATLHTKSLVDYVLHLEKGAKTETVTEPTTGTDAPVEEREVDGEEQVA